MARSQKTAIRTPPPVSLPLSDVADVSFHPRSRAGILRASADLVAEGGLKGLTMAGVARRAGLAKATVYNHMRDRDELVSALLADQWSQLRLTCAAAPRDIRLTVAATWISESVVLAGLRTHDPSALVRLAEQAVTDDSVLDEVGTWAPDGANAEAALRWLLSFVVAPHAAQSAEQAVQADSPEILLG